MSATSPTTQPTHQPADPTTRAGRRPGHGLLRPWRRLVTFLAQVAAELGQVTWPTRAQTVRYTGVVVAFLVAMVALVGGADAVLAAATTRLFG